MLAQGCQERVTVGGASHSPEGQSFALVQTERKVLPFVFFCRAAFVASAASDWDFWEAFAALSEGSTAPFKLSTSRGGFGSDELSSQSKCAKQPILFLEQKYQWAAGKQSSANIALVAVRPENNDSSQVFSI